LVSGGKAAINENKEKIRNVSKIGTLQNGMERMAL
jgi:hypothetical protein